MKEFLQFVVQQLVNNPNAVEVRETRGDTASILELRVAKEDLGSASRGTRPSRSASSLTQSPRVPTARSYSKSSKIRTGNGF